MDLDLRDVHVLITGAAGGIGLATVTEFLGHSALVSAHYRSTKAALEENVTCALASKESRLACVQADVTKEEDVVRMFSEAEEKIGKPVSVLVGERQHPLVQITRRLTNTIFSQLITPSTTRLRHRYTRCHSLSGMKHSLPI